MEKMKFVALDAALTGKKIKSVIKASGYSVKELQGMLGLSCPQSVYKWMSGCSLPSLDNLYMMHRIFGMHMEDMLVPEDADG